MAKKQKNSIKYLAILFAVVGVVMTVLNFVNFGDKGGFTGLQVI